jgi:hypothetical protein
VSTPQPLHNELKWVAVLESYLMVD